MMESTLLFLDLGLAAATLASILSSIAVPERRTWPPKRNTAFTPVLVWVPTFSLFGILILLGVCAAASSTSLTQHRIQIHNMGSFPTYEHLC